MSEVVSLYLGETGVASGRGFWRLLSIENLFTELNRPSLPHLVTRGLHSFYEENAKGEFVPRSLLVDLDPRSIDGVAAGGERSLFPPEHCLAGGGDPGCNFARAARALAPALLPRLAEALRRRAEACDSLQGFVLCLSGSGGAGGLAAPLLPLLAELFPNRVRAALPVFSCAQTSRCLAEPYNSLLFMQSAVDHSELSVPISDESLLAVCAERLKVPRPGPASLNRLVAHANSALTFNVRRQLALNSRLSDFVANLVPYPRINSLGCSLAPLKPADDFFLYGGSAEQLVERLFGRPGQLSDCDLRDGTVMASCLTFAGDCPPADAEAALAALKARGAVRFIDWSSSGYKFAVCPGSLPVFHDDDICPEPRSAFMLANSTAVTRPIAKLTNRFNSLFSKKAFLHWFTREGMEEAELQEAWAKLHDVAMDYESIEVDSFNENKQVQPGPH